MRRPSGVFGSTTAQEVPFDELPVDARDGHRPWSRRFTYTQRTAPRAEGKAMRECRSRPRQAALERYLRVLLEESGTAAPKDAVSCLRFYGDSANAR
jgi:hypothetical protein